MSKIMWLHDPGAPGGPLRARRHVQVTDGRVLCTIRTAEGPEPARRRAATSFAWPERVLPPGISAEHEQAARREGARAITLWRDAERSEPLAHVITRAAARRQGGTYEVTDPAGNALALITRSPAGFINRTCWTIQPAGTSEAAAGRKGDPILWTLWWTLLWLPSPHLIALVLMGLHSGTSPTPRRTTWQVAGRTVLDYADGPALYELRLPDSVPWDPRVTAALLSLLESFPGWLTRGRPHWPL